MFKRSLTSCVAAAALTTSIAVPANAYELTIRGDVCAVRFSAAEQSILRAVNQDPSDAGEISRPEAPENLAGAQAANESNEQDIARFEQELKNPDTTPARKEWLQGALELLQNLREYYDLYFKVYTNCIDGRNHWQIEDDAKAALSSDDGTPNGAGIGLIVGGVLLGFLGLIAAALPAIAPMLPVQIRDMLHI